MDEIFGVKDVAKACDVTTATVRNWDRCGRLQAKRTPSGVRIFNKADVDRIVAELASLRTVAAKSDGK